MSDASEQLIQLITMIRPLASTESGLEVINKTIFSEHKVAEECVKLMATLGLVDADALENALASMVPAQPTAPPLSNGAHSLIPQTQAGFGLPTAIPPFAPPPLPQQNVYPPTLGYDSRNAYAGSNQGQGWGAPLPPPVARPGPIIPAFAQNLPPDQQTMVLAAINMSQAELDMLPPPQRAALMELRIMAGK